MLLIEFLAVCFRGPAAEVYITSPAGYELLGELGIGATATVQPPLCAMLLLRWCQNVFLRCLKKALAAITCVRGPLGWQSSLKHSGKGLFHSSNAQRLYLRLKDAAQKKHHRDDCV